MADELVDVVDENDNVIGQEWKSKCHKEGILHRIAAIFIFNDKGELLLQRRSLKKSSGSGLLDFSASGHIAAGEDNKRGAIKELNEELGINVKIKRMSIEFPIEYHHEKNGLKIQHKLFLFVGYHNGPFNIQEDEIDSVAFYDLEIIEKMISDSPNKFTEGFKLGFKSYIERK
ncbi:MAG: NUDIX domain-containing protein [Nanoarchaeota archaeon]